MFSKKLGLEKTLSYARLRMWKKVILMTIKPIDELFIKSSIWPFPLLP